MPPSVGSVDTTNSAYAVLVDDVLPAEAVTVFFLDGSGDYDPVCIIQKSQILHDLCSIYGRYDAAALIRSSASANLCLGLKAFIRVELPVVDVANAYRVDVGVVAISVLPVPI